MIQNRYCENCQNPYEAKSGASKYCSPCSVKKAGEAARKATTRYRANLKLKKATAATVIRPAAWNKAGLQAASAEIARRNDALVIAKAAIEQLLVDTLGAIRAY